MKEKIGINLIKNYNIQVGSHQKPELPTKAATTRTKSFPSIQNTDSHGLGESPYLVPLGTFHLLLTYYNVCLSNLGPQSFFFL
jgi:hypothetical protein